MSSARERFKELNGGVTNDTPIDEYEAVVKPKRIIEPKVTTNGLDVAKNKFGVYKVEKPKKDSQASFRVPKDIHDEFRRIVTEIYYPQKPNYNETMIQIMSKFNQEYNDSKK